MEGGRISVATTVACVLLLVVVLATAGTGDAGWLFATRATARVSLVLLLPVAAASSVNALWGGRVGKWLLRNRRHLGLSFAASHAVHAVAFLGYAAAKDASIVALVSGATLYGGGFGYAMIAAMSATSFGGAVRWMGRRRWVVLHRTGLYVLLGIFLFTYLPGALAGQLLGTAATAALVGVLALRVAARVRATRRKPQRASKRSRATAY
ncbi:MAG: hypothetical protein AAF721_28000 [Myxococcota bacterium]